MEGQSEACQESSWEMGKRSPGSCLWILSVLLALGFSLSRDEPLKQVASSILPSPLAVSLSPCTLVLTTAFEVLRFWWQSSHFEILLQKFKGIEQSYNVLMSRYLHAHFTQCYVYIGPVSRKHSRKTSTSASLITLKPLTVWSTTNCGKFLKEMGMPDHLTCLLRNLYAGQEATVRTGRGITDWERSTSRLYIVTLLI